MVSDELRANVVSRVRRLARSLTSAERLEAACEWISWSEFLDDWHSALSPSRRRWFWDSFSPEAEPALRALDATLRETTDRRRRESASRFAASQRFVAVSAAATALLEALDSGRSADP